MMASVEVIESKGITDFESKVIEASILALSEHKESVLETIKGYAPMVSGNLASALSVSDIIHYGKSRIAVRFFFDEKIAPYWRTIIYGSKGGKKISPVNKRALSFDWNGGRAVFKSVVMAPIKANNFVRRGMREAGRKITGLVGSKFVTFLRR
jgi:hypothetical protein